MSSFRLYGGRQFNNRNNIVSNNQSYSTQLSMTQVGQSGSYIPFYSDISGNLIGPTGYSSTGYTGPTGYSSTGYTGPTGISMTGATGPTGISMTGYTGPTGYSLTGYTGPTGFSMTGATGPTGFSMTGQTGPTGYSLTGYTGPTGFSMTGATGPTGYSSTGYTGATGPSVDNIIMNNDSTTTLGVGYTCALNSSPLSDNVAVGYASLYLNGSGSVAGSGSNTAIGVNVLNQNIYGSNNVAVGYQSMGTGVTGSNNVAIGSNTLYNSNVDNLVAVGYNALASNTTGTEQVAIGYNALASNTTGTSNVAIGYNALASNTMGNQSIAIGYNAMQNYNYTTGGGGYNIAMGANAYTYTLDDTNIPSGVNNIIIGANSGGAVQYYGGLNVIIGSNCVNSNDTTVQSNNIVIGFNTSIPTPNPSNSVFIGNVSIDCVYFAGVPFCTISSGNGQIMLCDNVVSNTLSDSRDKINILPTSVGLSFIEQVEPVTFNKHKRLKINGVANEVGNANEVVSEARGAIEPTEIGFIAQDLLKAQKELGITIPNLVNDSNPNRYYIDYKLLIPVLVNSVKELNTKIITMQWAICILICIQLYFNVN